MKNISQHVPYSKCCGCGACANTCSKGAISMVENHEGFLVPQVDESKCIDCGLCLKACPALQDKRPNAMEPDCYAAQAPDPIRAVSSSGGVFTPIAEKILERGGYVCGAAFREDWTVHHIIIDNKEELAKLRGSKYVQSDTEDCYKRIKALLREGKWVLFSGTPCQVAGLYTYLGKDYDTLVTVDIFCHGVPSPGVWKRYLRENYNLADITNVNFRDKKAIGWSCSHVAITKRDGTKDVSNEYTKWFHSSVILRPSCQNCKHSKLPRAADISLGDWWGISRYDASLNDGKGLSNVLVNSPKGQEILGHIRFAVKHRINLSADYNNGNLRFGKSNSIYRDDFFNSKIALNTEKQTKETMKEGSMYDICYVGNFYSNNYGSMLVHYAVAKLLELEGVSVLMLDKPDTIKWPDHQETTNVIPYAFARRYYKNISYHYRDIDNLAETNDYCKGYVVGSDQMFNLGLHMDSIVYLQFARKDKLKIAFGTSFGHNVYRTRYETLYKNKMLLQRFDFIALRERPHNIVDNLLELDSAVEIIDPTLILPREYYFTLADTATHVLPEKPYLLTYVLDMNPDKEKAIRHIAKELGLEIINIPNNNKREWNKYDNITLRFERSYNPEEFLCLYKNASFVVTDSYHGSCFSIVFRKPFVSIVNLSRGKLRYGMFDTFGLSHRFYPSPNDIYKTDAWMKPVDYTEAAQIIEKKAQFARNWLADALSSLTRKNAQEHDAQPASHTAPANATKLAQEPSEGKSTICSLRKRMSKAIAYPVRDFFRGLRHRIIGR